MLPHRFTLRVLALALLAIGCGGRGLHAGDAGTDTPARADAHDGAQDQRFETAPPTDGAAERDDAGADATDASAVDGPAEVGDARDDAGEVEPAGPFRYLGTYSIKTPYSSTATAIGPDGSYYLAGSFSQAIDFDPGPGVDLKVPAGNDLYLVKLAPDGSYAWSVTWAGTGTIAGVARLAVSSTAIVLAGFYDAAMDFDPSATGTAVRSAISGGTSGFVVSLALDRTFQWASAFISTSSCGPSALALDAAGDVYVTGGFTAITDFDPGPGTDLPPTAGIFQSGFLVKLAGADGRRLWSTFYGGASCDGALRGATVSADGNVWVMGGATGCTFAGATPPNGPVTTISSFTPAGAPRFAGWLQGADVYPGSLAAAPDGSIYVGGNAVGEVDLDPGPGVETRELMQDNSSDLFVLKLSATGQLRWIHTVPILTILGLVTRPDNGVIALGNPRDSQTGDSLGTLLIKLESDGTPDWTLATGLTGSSPSDIAAGATGFSVSGAAELPTDYDPGPAIDMHAGGVTFLSRFAD